MKLLYSVIIFSLFLVAVICYLEDYEFSEYEYNEYDPFYLENYQTSNENCTMDKTQWCTGQEISYNCTDDEKTALNEEQKTFDEFMTTLQKYEKLKTSRFTIECIDRDNIRPVEVKLNHTDDKELSKYYLYRDYYEEISLCNNCLNYSTPIKYVNCILPVRGKMINALSGIMAEIKKYLTNSVLGHRNRCTAVLT